MNSALQIRAPSIEGAFSFSTRMGDEPGTNPEELLGAALAGCYAMALNATLEKEGKTRWGLIAAVTAGIVAGGVGATIAIVGANNNDQGGIPPGDLGVKVF